MVETNPASQPAHAETTPRETRTAESRRLAEEADRLAAERRAWQEQCSRSWWHRLSRVVSPF